EVPAHHQGRATAPADGSAAARTRITHQGALAAVAVAGHLARSKRAPPSLPPPALAGHQAQGASGGQHDADPRLAADRLLVGAPHSTGKGVSVPRLAGPRPGPFAA